MKNYREFPYAAPPFALIRVTKKLTGFFAASLSVLVALALLSNLIMFFFRKENLVPADLAYLGELPVLCGSIKGAASEHILLNSAFIFAAAALVMTSVWYAGACSDWASATEKQQPDCKTV